MSSVLLLSCPDRPGIVAATAAFLASQGGNIIHAEQHVKGEPGSGDAVFFQRLVVDLVGREATHQALIEAIQPLATGFDMTVDVRDTRVSTPTAIMCSKQPHCLYDLLARWRSGEMPMDLRVVISNHPDHADIAGYMGVPFFHLPVTKETKAQQETEVLTTLAEHGVELVVLARYMQILSDDFVSHFPMKIINIHHSFLPAFIGANPYRQAHDRGVKLIGATAHYATAELDEGPIIAQDTSHVSHRDDVEQLTSIGRDLETTVLARAVRAHLEHRVAVHGHQTIVYA